MNNDITTYSAAVSLLRVRWQGDFIYAKVDRQDYPKVSVLKWHAVRTWRRGPGGELCETLTPLRMEQTEKKRRRIWLSRFITGAQRGQKVRHRDGDGMNNARANLRVIEA